MRTPAEIHQALLGTVPSPTQDRLYQCGRRGFFGSSKSTEHVEATLIMVFTELRHPDRRVAVITPNGQEDEVLQQIRGLARRMIKSVAARSREGVANPSVRQHLTHQLGRMTLMQRNPLPGVAPDLYWVAVGFEKQEALPSWLSEMLLDP